MTDVDAPTAPATARAAPATEPATVDPPPVPAGGGTARVVPAGTARGR
ncbi:hypothetical protein [Micromonospora tarensis]|uniref:Uncharacterized protein n=1 Tax=Micromonospora tarensis TaxID=2806100 RepID=A0ABS1YSK6_9ACTN|nr:hypothetical protein [Micromonospora tarensis]MBM0280124.1 hypothetical protein [Micromonospora tarensis]